MRGAAEGNIFLGGLRKFTGGESQSSLQVCGLGLKTDRRGPGNSKKRISPVGQVRTVKMLRIILTILNLPFLYLFLINRPGLGRPVGLSFYIFSFK